MTHRNHSRASAGILGLGPAMVASDGGVFNFATDRDFLGSLGGRSIPSPIVGIAPLGG